MSKKKQQHPPRIGEKLFRLILPESEKSSLLGDYEELYKDLAQRRGWFFANLWYGLQILITVPSVIWDSTKWSVVMIRNYFKIAFRNINKHKVYSIINIIGLSIGLAFCILIYLFIKDELSYNRFHENADSVYSIVANDHYYTTALRRTPAPMAPELKNHFSEIENFVRLAVPMNVVRFEEKMFRERVHIVDSQFFEVFTFPLIIGNPKTVLQSDNSVVLTKSVANKYFGRNDPLGKMLSITFGEEQKPFMVSGISSDPPANSTLQFGILININNLRFVEEPDPLHNWNRDYVSTYLLLKEDISTDLIEKNILDISKPFRGNFYDLRKKYGSLKNDGETITYSLQNIEDIYLRSAGIWGSQGGNIQKSYILAGIAFIVLFLGIINFVNLSVTRASGRALEIGIRKVLGAKRKQCIRQFWMESVFITFISFILGFIISNLLLPIFNNLANKNLNTNYLYSPLNIIVFLILVFVVGIVSGSYPALVMTNFKITDIFKGKIKIGGRNIFRKVLVLFQFSLSIFFIVSASVMSKQIDFIRSHDIGFEKAGVIVVQLHEENAAKNRSNLKLFKDRVKGYHTVQNVSGCETSPNRTVLMGAIDIEGKRVDAHFNSVDFDYINTMKLRLVEGRDFSVDFSTDTLSVIVNRRLAKEYDGAAVGKIFREGRQNIYTIIGVVEDYNFMSLEEDISPAVIYMGSNARLNFALVRISLENITETIQFIEKSWKEIQPDKPFLYSFLYDDIEQFYNETNRMNSIVRYSSILTILVTCMGIFGLTLMTTTHRIKEIAIRKVCGATYQSIIGLVIKEIITLVAVSNIIAWPFAYVSMTKWLQEFAYRTDLNMIPFLSSAILILLISILTVSYIAIKAALSNPVDSLKYE